MCVRACVRSCMHTHTEVRGVCTCVCMRAGTQNGGRRDEASLARVNDALDTRRTREVQTVVRHGNALRLSTWSAGARTGRQAMGWGGAPPPQSHVLSLRPPGQVCPAGQPAWRPRHRIRAHMHLELSRGRGASLRVPTGQHDPVAQLAEPPRDFQACARQWPQTRLPRPVRGRAPSPHATAQHAEQGLAERPLPLSYPGRGWRR